jgi:hypothetical protein
MDCKRARANPIDTIKPRNQFVGGTRGVLPYENVIASCELVGRSIRPGKAGARICCFFDATAARPDYTILVAGIVPSL